MEERALLEARLMRKTGITPLTPSSASPGPKPLTFAQESLWFIDQFVPNSSLYNIPHVLRLKGDLNIPAMQKSIEWVANRHGSLRSSFVSTDGKPMQMTADEVRIDLPVADLMHFSSGERMVEARRRIDEESRRPFDLRQAPLLRANLLKLDSDEHILMLTMHHIISDLWSFQVFYKELTLAYGAFSADGTPSSPAVKMQFSEYGTCQRQRAAGDRYQEEVRYWKEQLSGELPSIELPTDHPRPAELSFAGKRRPIEMPQSILNGVKEFSRRHNVTPFVTLMAAFQTLLHRYSNQTDIIVGSPMSGRMDVATEEMIGMLINTLPIRAGFEGNPTFVEVIQRVKASVLGALSHQEAPVEKLIDDLKIPRKGARNPLFQTVFQFVPDTAPALHLPGVSVEPLEIELGTAKFEITVTLAESAKGLVGDIEYSTELFDDSTIDRMVLHFQTLIESVITNPDRKVSLIPFLPAAELERVTKTWAAPAADYPRNATIAQLFEEQVAKSPDAVAIIFQNQKLSYHELNCRANRLARHLQKLGVGPDTMVGFCVERSLEMVIGLLGILKAGGAYVTLDPNSPRDRLAYMFADTKASVFVTTNKFRELASGGATVVSLDEPDLFVREDETNPPCIATVDNLAYVIYTSGSTGKPKGVLVPHRGVVRLVKETNYLRFTPDDVFLQFATISFDASTLELWGPLLNGGKLVVFPPQFDSIEQLGRTIRDNGITTLWLTAGLFHEMVDHRISDLKTVRYLLAGGDVLSPSHVVKALRELPDTQLINGYGPTENTTFTCCYRVPKDWQGERSVPIGSPISNTQVYILDEQLQPVAIGMPGELFIGGDGLAREYLNAPELTAQKFVSNPFNAETGATLYRTGDRVRWLPDGTVEFLGRLDTQVKIRGFRIELSEVESSLAKHPAVQQCVVTAREDNTGTRQLVGYVIFKPEASHNAAELREFLARELPAYMVPSAFVALDAFPLNANGKVDRRQLPAPAGLLITNEKSAVPANPSEEKIAQIWSEVLGIDPPGIDESFFELGGHSLLATRVISRVNSAFTSNLPLRALFEAPTVSGLAKLVAQGQSDPGQSRPMLRRSRRSRELAQIVPEDKP